MVSHLVEKLDSEDGQDSEDELDFVHDHILKVFSHELRPWKI